MGTGEKQCQAQSCYPSWGIAGFAPLWGGNGEVKALKRERKLPLKSVKQSTSLYLYFMVLLSDESD